MTILADAPEEARRIVMEAAGQGLRLRLLGGLAIRLHSPSASHRSLARNYPDLDFAYGDRRAHRVEAFITGQGYEPNKTFNLLNGDHRLLFYDEGHQRQIDVFVGAFHMCHHLTFSEERLARDPLTLPLGELLLTKLQIVQMNEKDVRDVVALLLDHPLGEGDEETINLPQIIRLCAEDWGWWKTVNVSLERVRETAASFELETAQRSRLKERLDALQQALEAEPKSLKWKIRARVGERVAWYELPEEVRRG